ncbi:hypothetical protein [Photobacterium profundum]|uniref:Uncharacterized protein n=1 Tax=Photobacterium profundum (strain SS9) TaxID=298386 RepID=Q6LGF6_PHOPR|nr:hypothetical protein [Photobacterium profundum]CAG23624.1 hypothetical protein PBPRB1764 [Photobacterium profundum SS9]
MEYQHFQALIKDALSDGVIFYYPGGGTSKVQQVLVYKVGYTRSKSTIYLSIPDMFSTFTEFSGSSITSNDLKRFMPEVYDSKALPAGNSCNCAFFFMVINSIGLAGNINGKGVRGDPFGIILK